MKSLALILTLYFSIISTFPCADIIGDLKTSKELHTVQSDQNDADGCAIFCICNCCGTVITPTPKQCDVDTPYQYASHFMLFVEHPLTSLSHTVWQPPKQS